MSATAWAFHESSSTHGIAAADDRIELSIVLPCLNEAETIGLCIKKALAFLHAHGIHGEVIIADNGSTDGSQQIANALGAHIIDITARGYGAALIGGIAAARGRFVAMGDADASYDFLALMPFIKALREGADLVMGNRFRGGIASGAMPLLHKYLGNPALSFLGRLFFGTSIRDFHCGLRAFRRDSIEKLRLSAQGMEFASEMVVKAALNGLDVREVPTTLSPDGRSRAPHLRTWRDGWRHLRFLLTYAPKWLFLYPGLMLAGVGAFGIVALAPGNRSIGDVEFGVTTLLFASMILLVGIQLTGFAVLARLHGVNAGMWPSTRGVDRFRRHFSVERGCQAGVVSIAAGSIFAAMAVWQWADAGFGAMHAPTLLRSAIPATLGILMGLQLISTSFLIGLVDDRPR